MAVQITVREVREALYLASGGRAVVGNGVPSTPQLGQWFHDCIAQLVSSDPQSTTLAALEKAEPNLDAWKKTLVDVAYSQFVGPRITREQVALSNVTPQVFAMWQAIQSACHWLAELSWSLRQTTNPRGSKATSAWESLTMSFATEQRLNCELREPGWSDSVRLVGIADAVLRLADTGRWCAIEYKLGQTSPEPDLGQACLYHLMLSESDAPSTHVSVCNRDGTLALVSFRPEKHEQVLHTAELATARQTLIELIGRLAGVASLNGDKEPTTTEAPVSGIVSLSPIAKYRELGKKLVKTLSDYRVSVSLDGEPVVGPTFLRFPIALGNGVGVESVVKRAPELQNKLKLNAAPFITQEEAGRLVVDVQRPDRQKVWFSEVQQQLPIHDPLLGCSKVPVGVDLNGELHFADLSEEHAHLLVAGATRSGKSEWLRMAVASLMLSNTTETLRLVVIDPKGNAFHSLQGSPYLWRPIVFPDGQSASRVLKELVDEMESRYQQFDGADSLAELSRRRSAPMPRIVCVCDEYADLIQKSKTERKLIEEQVSRLGAKARAAGIHLILATQRPSREVITGALDVNIPTRVALTMAKPIESRQMLGDCGAEQLLFNGDLLFKDSGSVRRLQAPLLPAGERDAIFQGKERPLRAKVAAKGGRHSFESPLVPVVESNAAPTKSRESKRRNDVNNSPNPSCVESTEKRRRVA